jgi:hypothetical protein
LSSGAWKRVTNDFRTNVDDEASLFLDSFVELFDDLYAQSGVKARPRFPVNRNAVLHGTDVRFGRQANALKLFLLLDAIHYFLTHQERAVKAVA